MRQIMRAVSVVALAVVAIMSVDAAMAAASTSAAGSLLGCPSGSVCLCADPSPAGGPIETWRAFGRYDLQDVNGAHLFVNNQTAGAGAYLCSGYNGAGSCVRVGAGRYVIIDFTQSNSIVLMPH